MRVVMRRQMSGTRDGKSWPAPGGTMDVTQAEADALVRQGMADHVEATSEPARKRETKPAPNRRETR